MQKCFYFIFSYRHPNQTADEVEIDILNLVIDKVKSEKPACIVLIVDFNARTPLFWEGDTKTWEGRRFSDFIISSCLEVLRSELTHI